MFYCFNQNNSGGSFDYNEGGGISRYVIVEGDNKEDIIGRAEDIGLYFDGCDSGMDCPCCGDRWYAPYDHSDLDDSPVIYGVNVEDYAEIFKWISGYEIFVHYKDGTVRGFWR